MYGDRWFCFQSNITWLFGWRRTGNYRTVLILNWYNLEFYLTFSRSHDIDKQQRRQVSSTVPQLSFQSFVRTGKKKSTAPADARFSAQGDSIVRATTVLWSWKDIFWWKKKNFSGKPNRKIGCVLSALYAKTWFGSAKAKATNANANHVLHKMKITHIQDDDLTDWCTGPILFTPSISAPVFKTT